MLIIIIQQNRPVYTMKSFYNGHPGNTNLPLYRDDHTIDRILLFFQWNV